MKNNEIIDNIDIQDIDSEVVEDVANAEMNIPGKIGISLCGFAVVACVGYAGYKAVNWGITKIKEVRSKEQSETEPVEVETEVVEN